MKKLRPFMAVILAVVLFAASCKKEGKTITKTTTTTATDSNYHIKLKANGVQKEFTVDASAMFTTSASGVYAASLYSYLDNANMKGVIIIISDGAPIDTGKTYNEKPVTIRKLTLFQTSINYIDKDSVTYFASGIVPDENISVRFSEIAPAYVKGTFSGKLRQIDSKPPYVYANVTEGEFYLKRTY